MRTNRTHALALAWIVVAIGCGDDSSGPSSANTPGNGGGSQSGDPSDPTPPGSPALPPTDPSTGPAAGNPDGACAVPAEAKAEDSSSPRTVVGTGTKESCTGAAFVAAVAKGGVITFDCGPNPTTITLTETAKVYNDTGPKVVIDGGNKITLSGGGKVRILYQNTCSSALRGGADCNDQEKPALTVQNITFIDGNATGLEKGDNEGGGGAIYVRGGRFKVVNARFFGNRCDELGSDVGGGAIRVLDFPSKGTSQTRPVHIVKSTFGASGMGNACANGGALSSIGTSYTHHEQPLRRQPRDRPRRQRRRGRQRRSDLQRRQHVHARSLRHAHREQPRQRGRKRDLLREQQPDGDAPHQGLRPAQEPEGHVRDGRLPGHVHHRQGRLSPGDGLDDRVGAPRIPGALLLEAPREASAYADGESERGEEPEGTDAAGAPQRAAAFRRRRRGDPIGGAADRPGRKPEPASASASSVAGGAVPASGGGAAITSTESVARLSSLFGLVVPLEALAIACSVPTCARAATMARSTSSPLRSLPSSQRTVAVPVQLPCVLDAETKVAPAGMGSVTAAPTAGEGPPFATCSL